MGIYKDECGDLPTGETPNDLTCSWWRCALIVAEREGICISPETQWSGWHYKVRQKISEVEGKYPAWIPGEVVRDGDYINIWMGAPTVWYQGKFKWACPPEAKGEITLCNINGSSCPNCGEANSGDEISVIAEMKNVGNDMGEFRFYIYDQDGNELSKEPDLSYKNVAAGAIWKVEKSLLVNLNFDMIDKTLNGTLKLVRQT